MVKFIRSWYFVVSYYFMLCLKFKKGFGIILRNGMQCFTISFHVIFKYVLLVYVVLYYIVGS